MALKSLFRLFLALFCTVLASSAFGQLDRKNILDASIIILGNQEVQPELKLTEQQLRVIRKEFQNYADRALELLAALRKDRSRSKELNKKLDGFQRILMDRCQAILSKGQKKRLCELGIQHWGPPAVVLPDVSANLKMTSAQIAKAKRIKKAFEDYRDEMERRQKALVQSIPQPKKTDKKAVEEYRKKLQKILNDFNKTERPKLIARSQQSDVDIYNVLSKSQKAQFEKMKGKILPKQK